MDRLFVVSATRMLYGNTSANAPSRFIEEMPEELVHRVAAGDERPQSAPEPETMGESAKSVAICPGSKVRHDKFGVGTVVAVTESAGDQVFTVAFPGQGIKKLIQSYAALELVK